MSMDRSLVPYKGFLWVFFSTWYRNRVPLNLYTKLHLLLVLYLASIVHVLVKQTKQLKSVLLFLSYSIPYARYCKYCSLLLEVWTCKSDSFFFVGQKMPQAFFYTLNLSSWFLSGQYWFSMMRYNKIKY